MSLALDQIRETVARIRETVADLESTVKRLEEDILDIRALLEEQGKEPDHELPEGDMP